MNKKYFTDKAPAITEHNAKDINKQNIFKEIYQNSFKKLILINRALLQNKLPIFLNIKI